MTNIIYKFLVRFLLLRSYLINFFPYLHRFLIFVVTLAYFFNHSILALTTISLLMAVLYQTKSPLLMISLLYFSHWFLAILVNGLQIMFHGIYGSTASSIALQTEKHSSSHQNWSPRLRVWFSLLYVFFVSGLNSVILKSLKTYFTATCVLCFIHIGSTSLTSKSFLLGVQCVVILNTSAIVLYIVQLFSTSESSFSSWSSFPTFNTVPFLW